MHEKVGILLKRTKDNPAAIRLSGRISIRFSEFVESHRAVEKVTDFRDSLNFG